MIRSLRDRLSRLGASFGNLLLSDTLMLLSTSVGHVAVPWWITQQGGTHDLVLYGAFVAVATMLGMTVLSPFGDRYPKRLMITVGLALYAVEAFALVVAVAHYSIALIIALEMIPVVARSLIEPASSSIVAELLPPDKMPDGFSLQKSAQTVGRMLGPALGGAALAWAGTRAALWLHFGLLVCAVPLALRIEAPPDGGAGGGVEASRARQWWNDLRGGLFAIWSVPLERGWMLVNFIAWIFLFPAIGLLVPLKVQSLGLSGGWLGSCEASLSFGMLAGALGGSNALSRGVGRYATRVGGAVVEGLALAVAGYTHTPWLLVVAFGCSGFANSTLVLVAMTHRMLARPREFRARMASVGMLTTQLAAALGPPLVGVALIRLSVNTVYMSCGALAAVSGLGLVLVPGFRSFMAMTHEEVTDLYRQSHPHAFSSVR